MLRPRLGAAISPATITAAAINRLWFIIAAHAILPSPRARARMCVCVCV